MYGGIHSFLHINSKETSDTSKLHCANFMLTPVFFYYFFKLDFVVYNDGCNLKKFATNPVRSNLTDTSKRIRDMHIVVDKMHFKGYVDFWCKRHCNLSDFAEPEMVHCNVLYYKNKL